MNNDIFEELFDDMEHSLDELELIKAIDSEEQAKLQENINRIKLQLQAIRLEVIQ